MFKGLPTMSVSLMEGYVVIITSDFQQIHSLNGIPVSHHPDLDLGLSPFPQFPQIPATESDKFYRRFIREFTSQQPDNQIIRYPWLYIYMSFFHYFPLPSNPGFCPLLIAPLAVPIPYTILLDAFPILLSLSLPFYSPPTANFCSVPNQRLVFLGLS